MTVKTIMTDLLRNERGATAIEYGLIASLIVIAIMGAIQGFAGEADKMWTDVAAKTAEATSKAGN